MSEKKKTYKQVDDLVSYRTVFLESENGQKVLHDIMKAHYYNDEVYKGDPYELVFKAGAKGVVTRILRILNMDPAKLQLMLKEREAQDV